jgi:hypothetical protein
MRKLIFTLPLVSLVWCNSAIGGNPEPAATLLHDVEGTWGWKDYPDNSCEKSPHTLSFADGGKKMILKQKSGKVTVYQVLYAENNQITMLIEGEERRTEFGDRVIWVLVLNNPNDYQWRRTDWKPQDKTKEIVRCR